MQLGRRVRAPRAAAVSKMLQRRTGQPARRAQGGLTAPGCEETQARWYSLTARLLAALQPKHIRLCCEYCSGHKEWIVTNGVHLDLFVHMERQNTAKADRMPTSSTLTGMAQLHNYDDVTRHFCNNLAALHWVMTKYGTDRCAAVGKYVYCADKMHIQGTEKKNPPTGAVYESHTPGGNVSPH